MNSLTSEIRSEKRSVRRNPVQQFVKLQVIEDEENESAIALTTDISEAGISLLTYIPLPVGTRVQINRDQHSALGEVSDWEWDYALDMARLGVRLLEKHGCWPLP